MHITQPRERRLTATCSRTASQRATASQLLRQRTFGQNVDRIAGQIGQPIDAGFLRGGHWANARLRPRLGG